MRGLKSLICILLSMIMAISPIFSILPIVYANSWNNVSFDEVIPSGYTFAGSNQPSWNMQLWHYSGGYWANTTLGIKIDDSEMRGLYLGTLDADALNKPYKTLAVDLPNEVKNYISGGGKLEDVKIKFTTSNLKPIDLFKQLPIYQIQNNKIQLEILPMLRVKRNDPVFANDKMNVLFPKIAEGYGNNVYSIFTRSGTHLGMNRTIQTEDILNEQGHLKGGKQYTIITDSGTSISRDGSEIKIGHNTFSNGGAVGLEFLFPVKAEYYIPSAKLDYIRAQFVEEGTNKKLKDDKMIYPTAKGITRVNHEAIAGYKLVDPTSGYYDVNITDAGKEIVVVFKYKKILNPYATVSGEVNPNPAELNGGKASVRVQVRGRLFQLEDDTVNRCELAYKKPGALEWTTYNVNESTFEAIHTFDAIDITKAETFPIKATFYTQKGKTIVAEGKCDVFVTGKDWEIKPDIRVTPSPTIIQISQEDFDNDVGTDVTLRIASPSSTATKGLKSYQFSYKLIDTAAAPWLRESPNINHPTYEWLESGQYIKQTIKPSDIKGSMTVPIRARVVVEDQEGNMAFKTGNAQVQFEIIKPPPETKLIVPIRVYPKEITNQTSLKNRITWTYRSPSYTPYGYSVLSIYKVVNGVGTILTEYNQKRIEKVDGAEEDGRYIFFTGDAGVTYRSEVRVVDAEGIISEADVKEFVVEEIKPNILAILETDDNEENLNIAIHNLNHTEIENLYPTTYTTWDIKEGTTTIASGTGKAPASVPLNNSYRGKTFTFTQRARNNLNNTAEDFVMFGLRSGLGFNVEPSSLFENDMAQIIDTSIAATNINYNIRLNGHPYAPLELDNEDRFTRSLGKYTVRQNGKIKGVIFIPAFEYAEFAEQLTGLRPKPLKDDEINVLKTMYNAETYLTHYAKWSSADIEEANLEEGRYRREVNHYFIAINDHAINKPVEFLSKKPNADFAVNTIINSAGDKHQDSNFFKMHKKIRLDGTKSIEATDPALQAAYPVNFNSTNTQFMIEPVNADGTLDTSRNAFILGTGRVEENGKVIFKAKQIQEIRIDKEGWYRFSYRVSNTANFLSDWVSVTRYVQKEENPVIVKFEKTEKNQEEIKNGNWTDSVKANIEQRDPKNSLKTFFELSVIAVSPDDAINHSQSKLYIGYDSNNDGKINISDGNFNYLNTDNTLKSSNHMFVMRNSSNFYKLDSQDFIKVLGFDIVSESNSTSGHMVEYKIRLEVDHPQKNALGLFSFEFLVEEEPNIPNFVQLGAISNRKADTVTSIIQTEKNIFIDNQAPWIEIETDHKKSLDLIFLKENATRQNIQNSLDEIKARLGEFEVNIYILEFVNGKWVKKRYNE